MRAKRGGKDMGNKYKFMGKGERPQVGRFESFDLERRAGKPQALEVASKSHELEAANWKRR